MRQSKQDYLKTIVNIEIETGLKKIKISAIAKHLSISPPAVSDMVKKLESENLLHIESYKGVTLTKQGRSTGLKILRHHRIWETFLSQKLDIPWENIHTEADRLEHASSDSLINKLSNYLGNPQFDPHGEPIPDENGNLPKMDGEVPLSQVLQNQKFVIKRLLGLNNEMLMYLSSSGIQIGSILTVTNRLDTDELIVCELNEKQVTLSRKSSERIFGQKISD